MKVKVELNKDQDLPLAVIYTDKMSTPEKASIFPGSACMRSTSSWARTSCRFPNKPSST